MNELTYKPDNVAGFRIGDYVELPNINEQLRVIDLQDPILVLESPSGHKLRAGWRAVTLAATADRLDSQ